MDKASTTSVEKDKTAKSFTNRVTTNSMLQNCFVFALAYCGTHHYFLFAICGFALTMGVTNLFAMLIPTVLFNSLINIGYLVYYLIASKKPLTRYPLLMSMNASQLATLAFIYAFGYFTPTLYVFQKQAKFDTNFLTQIVISNLAYDLIFTVGLSTVMLGRVSLR